MAQPDAFEQYTVQLINQARIDPEGEFDRLVADASTQTGASESITSAIRYFDVDLDAFKAQVDALTPVAPVAWNSALGDSSQSHTAAMVAQDTQAHQLPGEADFGSRVSDAGYQYSHIGENIFLSAKDALYDHAGYFIDWTDATETGIQTPPGHRNNIMNADFTEVGVGHVADDNPATMAGPHAVTEDFGNRFDYAAQVTGAIYDDADGDHFYSIGEGEGGATVTSGPVSATSLDAGGYHLALSPGEHGLTFSAPGLGSASISLTMGDANVEVDLFASGAFRSSVSAKLGSGGQAIELFGPGAIEAVGNDDDNVLTGSGADNVLAGAAGADHLDGGAGADMADFSASPGGVSVNLIAGTGTGSDASGDTYSSIEYVAGSDFRDTIIGTAGNNYIYGGGDADMLIGYLGNDRLLGGAGTDILRGEEGADRLEGGSGGDWTWYATSTGSVAVNLEAGKGFHGDAQGDTFSSIEYAYGSNQDDTLIGSSGGNYLVGGPGDDAINGEGGNDRLRGGPSVDTLFGGDGNDRFDFIHGDGVDYVGDFQDDIDTLQLMNMGFESADQALDAAYETNGNTVFDFGGGDVLVVYDMLKADLTDDIAVFHG